MQMQTENFDLEVVYLPVDSLTPYENNTRKHSPDDIEAIKQSIQHVGFLDPLGIWGPNNLIVEGHGRQIAAKELGIETVPCIRLDHLTEEQRKEYAIRHNRTAELSAWDFGKLEEELAALDIQGIDMSDLNFPEMRADLSLSDDDFIAGTENTKSKTKLVTCPHCGEKFEV
jgi:ParB-like chromosome segregation protein Spo0J